MIAWYQAKRFLEQASGISMDALHVLAGVLLLLALSLVMRRTVADWRPWAAVLAIALLNEAVDLWVEQWPSAARQYAEGAKDIALTMVLPTLIALSARAMPRLYRRQNQRRRARR